MAQQIPLAYVFVSILSYHVENADSEAAADRHIQLKATSRYSQVHASVKHTMHSHIRVYNTKYRFEILSHIYKTLSSSLLPGVSAAQFSLSVQNMT